MLLAAVFMPGTAQQGNRGGETYKSPIGDFDVRNPDLPELPDLFSAPIPYIGVKRCLG